MSRKERKAPTQAQTQVPAPPPPRPQPTGPVKFSVSLGVDQDSVVVTTSQDREIWLMPTEGGMRMLIDLLRAEHKRRGSPTISQSPDLTRRASSIPQVGNVPVSRYTESGKRVLTLADLGLE